MRSVVLTAALLLAAALPGCGDAPLACTTIYAFGVSATVRNAANNAPVVGATLVLVDGTYRETMMTFGTPGSYAGAGERAGTYTLTVMAPGFVTPPARTVVVTADECHVRGQAVTIDLTPM